MRVYKEQRYLNATKSQWLHRTHRSAIHVIYTNIIFAHKGRTSRRVYPFAKKFGAIKQKLPNIIVQTEESRTQIRRIRKRTIRSREEI